VLYVGSAVNLRVRFATHAIEIRQVCNREFDGQPSEISVKYRPCVKYGDWAMIELRLLLRLKPSHNRAQKAAPKPPKEPRSFKDGPRWTPMWREVGCNG
jgi:hypothetical protein